MPHFEVVDIVSDNRLMAHQAFTTTHEFSVSCDSPELSPAAVPLCATTCGWGWLETERIMVEALNDLVRLH